MPTIPAPVDVDGNITVPAEGGLVVPIKEQTNATPPVPINISATPMRFHVRGRVNKLLTINPNDALGKLLTLTEIEADMLSSSWTSFQLLDETNPLIPVPIWSGKIRRGT